MYYSGSVYTATKPLTIPTQEARRPRERELGMTADEQRLAR
jgi:hypothetical protein